MDNIFDIVKSFGIEIPSDKKEAFEKKVLENYKTVSEFNKLNDKFEQSKTEKDNLQNQYDTDIQKRDSDIKDLEKKLKDAGTDADKLATLQNDLTTLQTNYDNAKSDYEKQLAKQAYEFAVKEKVAELKFSSNSAKKAFIADAMNEEMKMKDGELQGFDAFLETYKKNDANAFASEDTPKPKDDDKPKPQFAGKSNPTESRNDTSNEGEKPSVTFW